MATIPILEAYARLKREMNRLAALRLKPLDMGSKQMIILYRLSQASHSMGELADFTQSDKATITRTVAALESAGWIQRVNDKVDRRKMLISLTALGRKKAALAIEVRNDLGKHLGENLSSQERKTLAELLEKVADGLSQQRK